MTSSFETNCSINNCDANQNYQWLLDVLESIQDDVFTLDRNWNFTYINTFAAKEWGFTPADLVQRNIWKTLPRFIGTALEANIREAMEKQQVRTLEWKALYAIGFREVTVFPSKEGVTVYSKNITERKKSEEALKKNTEQQAFLLKLSDAIRPLSNSLDVQVAITDIIRSAFQVDRCYYSILEADKAIIQRESARAGLPSVVGVYETSKLPIFLRVVNAGRPFIVNDAKTTDLLDEELRKLCIKLQVISFIDVPVIKNGQAVGVLSIVNGQPKEWTDLEVELASEVAGRMWEAVERAQAQEALLQTKSQLEVYSKNLERLVEERTKALKDSERLAAIGATAGMVGHDIRNPLQAMVSDIYLMKDEVASDCKCSHKDQIIESLVGIDDNISYINKIVQDLQDYARPLNPEFSDVALSKVLVKVFENIKVPDSIKLSIKVKDLEKTRTDPMLLQRALSNLVTNAIQAMPNGGNLEISAYPEGERAVILVSDTGVGIPDEVKPKLFAPMVTTKSKGQGFGLAVSKRIIEAMNGTVSFESQRGKGTKFKIELPSS
jgi:PAS domain S-box-containing protein